ncbi:hypothetical protein TWF730_006983 [Orbilia blumenaviensis]|uniref:Uncharacterized protein n=1 Tax=Orbilia blumenaviensis TaxID=1796055 RepID=A0AAV9VFX3_9PEZI
MIRMYYRGLPALEYCLLIATLYISPIILARPLHNSEPALGPIVNLIDEREVTGSGKSDVLHDVQDLLEIEDMAAAVKGRIIDTEIQITLPVYSARGTTILPSTPNVVDDNIEFLDGFPPNEKNNELLDGATLQMSDPRPTGVLPWVQECLKGPTDTMPDRGHFMNPTVREQFQTLAVDIEENPKEGIIETPQDRAGHFDRGLSTEAPKPPIDDHTAPPTLHILNKRATGSDGKIQQQPESTTTAIIIQESEPSAVISAESTSQETESLKPHHIPIEPDVGKLRASSRSPPVPGFEGSWVVKCRPWRELWTDERKQTGLARRRYYHYLEVCSRCKCVPDSGNDNFKLKIKCDASLVSAVGPWNIRWAKEREQKCESQLKCVCVRQLTDKDETSAGRIIAKKIFKQALEPPTGANPALWGINGESNPGSSLGAYKTNSNRQYLYPETKEGYRLSGPEDNSHRSIAWLSDFLNRGSVPSGGSLDPGPAAGALWKRSSAAEEKISEGEKKPLLETDSQEGFDRFFLKCILPSKIEVSQRVQDIQEICLKACRVEAVTANSFSAECDTAGFAALTTQDTQLCEDLQCKIYIPESSSNNLQQYAGFRGRKQNRNPPEMTGLPGNKELSNRKAQPAAPESKPVGRRAISNGTLDITGSGSVLAGKVGAQATNVARAPPGTGLEIDARFKVRCSPVKYREWIDGLDHDPFPSRTVKPLQFQELCRRRCTCAVMESGGSIMRCFVNRVRARSRDEPYRVVPWLEGNLICPNFCICDLETRIGDEAERIKGRINDPYAWDRVRGGSKTKNLQNMMDPEWNILNSFLFSSGGKGHGYSHRKLAPGTAEPYWLESPEAEDRYNYRERDLSRLLASTQGSGSAPIGSGSLNNAYGISRRGVDNTRRSIEPPSA